jgi:2-aminoadipate transaminase
MEADLSKKSAFPAFCGWLTSSNNITTEMMGFAARPGMISLAGGLPAPELYPLEAVEAATHKALARWGSGALEYGPIAGFPALREHIARRMSKEIGSPIAVENVLLTVGSMQALEGIGKILIEPGDTIVTQHPTYMGALDAWRPRTPVHCKFEWDLENPEVNAALDRAKFVYVVPNYSNPTGALVGTNSRRALLELAHERKVWIVEDDPYGSIQIDGEHGPSVLQLDAQSRSDGFYKGPVIYLGTLSKSLAPGFRIGWVVASPEVIEQLIMAKQCTDMTSSLFSQAVALELLETNIEQEIRELMVPLYRERRDALCAALGEHLGEWFTWDVPAGGMFVWLNTKMPTLDTARLYRIAVGNGVMFCPSHAFDHAGSQNAAMRLNFTRSPPDLLVEGVRRIAASVREYLDQSSGSPVSGAA